jgi:DegV family protein with EDD domain
LNPIYGGKSTKNVAVVTDSIACLTKELITEYDIGIIPINFYAGGKLYKDWVDITPSEAYKLFLDDPDSFKTSAASPEDCLQVLREASKKASEIFCVTVSNKLSMMYDVLCKAKEMARSEIPNIEIEVMDSRSATPSEGMVALAGARAAVTGANLPDVISAADRIREKVGAIVILDTMRHVFRSGRIPKIASQIGSVLNIKPILTVSEIVHFSGVIRNRKQGIERMLSMMRDKTGDSPVHVAVLHAYAQEEAEKLMKRIAYEFKCIELWLAEFSPVMGYACGTGTIGVAFYPEN